MANSFAERVIAFNNNLHYTGELPADFAVMNPFADNAETMQVMQCFYRKYYSDNNKRKFIIGINPSRHGAGVTGIPFTDTKRLLSDCGIAMSTAYTHEQSSVFVYDLIRQLGGAEQFYKQFYINSPFPLAILRRNQAGRYLNANYYDDKQLMQMVYPFMIETLQKHISFGLKTDKVYVLGTKNAQVLQKLNDKEKLFGELIALEHPRYIQQYQTKNRQLFIDKYIKALEG